MGIKIKYIDIRPIFIPKLENYKNGITPKKGQELTVTENEAKKLLNRKNGNKPCFEKVRTTPSRRQSPIETEEQ